MMKKLVSTLIAVCMLWGMSGCNSDIFLDEPDIPDGTSVTIEGDGGEAEYAVPTRGLKHISLDVFSESEKYCTYRNTSGEVIDRKSPAAQVGSIVFENDFTKLEILKSGGHLTVRSVCQTSQYEGSWTIRPEYDYGMRFIDVKVLPGKPRRLIDVRYSTGLKVTDKAEVRHKRLLGFKNDGSATQTYEAMPYLQETATFLIESAQKDSWVKGEKIVMDVPIYNNGTWQLEERADFYVGTPYRYYRPDQLLTEIVEIPPYSHVEIFADVTYSKAEASGTLTFLNEVLDRRLTVDFTATSYYPVSYEIRVENVQ